MEDLVTRDTGSDARLPDRAFWQGRRVLLTGHSGFKGAWLALMLARLGARIEGLSLSPEPEPSTYRCLGVRHVVAAEHWLDIRNSEALATAVSAAKPEIVFHLAAQALVGRGLRDPFGTIGINVTGTLNLLEALRRDQAPIATIAVTSDKVYRAGAAGHRHLESDPLGGDDPYSGSKAACELLVTAYRRLPGWPGALATARAGNVIGGGDFAEDRIVPDIIRAEVAGVPLRLRQPNATRPFQHVLDVLVGYLLLAEDLAAGRPLEAVNFGPDGGELSVARLLAIAETARGRPFRKEVLAASPYCETSRLALDSSLAREALRWRPRIDITEAVEITFEWYRAWQAGEDTAAVAANQIARALSS